ncbi:DNA repair protein RadA, partial [Candidatus Dojkabacteria bacterium]
DIDIIEHFIEKNSKRFKIIFIDSIQTLFTTTVSSPTGSVSQILECTNFLVNISKKFNIITFIIGHVTKSGEVAGPKMLEHMVDTVIYFEGEKRFELRVVRVEKNRFGPTDEVGIFRMTSDGLVEVRDTKELFENNLPDAPGSVFCMVLEGNRPVVVEVQALVAKSHLPQPRRTSSGFDFSRMNILIAVIEKTLGLNLSTHDVYTNVTGGIKVADAALDLAFVASVLSSLKNKAFPRSSVFFGEVGLTGEVRKVWLEEKRVKEARRIGFVTIVNHSAVKNIKNLL